VQLLLSKKKSSNHAGRRVFHSDNAHSRRGFRHANGNKLSILLGQNFAALCGDALMKTIRRSEWSLWIMVATFCRPMQGYMPVGYMEIRTLRAKSTSA
jgi:hypothetical protein